MKERPIIFTGAMVTAIREGRKTQTRRIINKPREVVDEDNHRVLKIQDALSEGLVLMDLAVALCPYGHPGDQLWVRETWAPMCKEADPYCWCETDEQRAENHYTEYRADTGNKYPGDWDDADPDERDDAPRWRSPYHMKRIHSRILLEVVNVWTERLQNITYDDMLAEGIAVKELADGRNEFFDGRITTVSAPKEYWVAFSLLWDKLNKKRATWESNPWVWVVEFKVVQSG